MCFAPSGRTYNHFSVGVLELQPALPVLVVRLPLYYDFQEAGSTWPAHLPTTTPSFHNRFISRIGTAVKLPPGERHARPLDTLAATRGR